MPRPGFGQGGLLFWILRIRLSAKEGYVVV